MKWLPPENELDREQRDFLDKIVSTQNNINIIGFPGSGKTVLLLYAVTRLRKKNNNIKILIVEYTYALINMLKAAIYDISKDSKYRGLHLEDIKIVSYFNFAIKHQTYDCIICDEVQDMPTNVILLMKQRAKRVIVGGDPNQSIFEKDPYWGKAHCSIPELDAILNPIKLELTIVHKLTKKIASAISSFLPSMRTMPGQIDMTQSNVDIRLWKSENERHEVVHLMDEAISKTNFNYSVGILFPSHSGVIAFANWALENAQKPTWIEKKNKYGKPDFKSLNDHLANNGIPMQYIANGYGDFNSTDLITITTYHSSKGLSFNTVMLPFCNDSFMAATITPALFMVAMTRSIENLFISYSSSTPFNYVRKFSASCHFKDWSVVENDNNDDTDIFGF